MPTTTLYPNGDGTISGTVMGTAGPPYYVNVDEGTASPNDSDSIVPVPSGHIFLLLTDMPAEADTITGVTVKIRTSNSSKGDSAVSSFQLFQSNESTALIAQTTISGSTTVTTYTFNPSITGATTKAAWDGARLKVSFTGASGTSNFYACQVEVTYSVAGASYTSSVIMTF